MSSLLKNLSISIKIHVVKRYGICLASFFSKVSTESVGSRCELVAIANCVHTADATQLDSFVASASAVCIGHNTHYIARFIAHERKRCNSTSGLKSVHIIGGHNFCGDIRCEIYAIAVV